MERREIIKGTGATLALMTMAQLANSQTVFSYDKAITTNQQLKFPEGEKIKVAFMINPGVQVIDLAGPWEVFQDVYFTEGNNKQTIWKAFELYTVSDTSDVVKATAGLQIVPNYTVDNAPDPDITVIPHFSTTEFTAIHDWIKDKSSVAKLTMSICTGLFQLARTGLVDNQIVTTNQDAYDLFEQIYPKPILKRGPRFVEIDGIATSGGLTAGIDLALRTVERIFDRSIAQKTANGMEYTSDGWKV